MGTNGKVRHIKKFMGGRMTPEEVHSKYAFPPGARCECCKSSKLSVRAITLAPFSDVMSHSKMFGMLDPVTVAQMIVQIKGSDGRPIPYVRIGIVYACKQCVPVLERFLAKLPSWVIVEINRPPKPIPVITSG